MGLGTPKVGGTMWYIYGLEWHMFVAEVLCYCERKLTQWQMTVGVDPDNICKYLLHFKDKSTKYPVHLEHVAPSLLQLMHVTGWFRVLMGCRSLL